MLALHERCDTLRLEGASQQLCDGPIGSLVNALHGVSGGHFTSANAFTSGGALQGHADDVLDSTVEDARRSLQALADETRTQVDVNRRLVRAEDLELDASETLLPRGLQGVREKCGAEPPASVTGQQAHTERARMPEALEGLR